MKLLDLHCDTVTVLESVQLDLENEVSAVTLEKARMLDAKAYAQCFAMFLSDEHRGQDAIEKWERTYRWFCRQMELYADSMEQVFSGTDLDRIEQEGKIAAILTTESAAAFAGNLERIEAMRKKGCLITSLTWNGATEAAGGVYTPETGLTGFGKEAVREMERVGMVVDISHMCDKAVDDFLRIADRPFVATHSNCRPVCNAARNLTDRYVQEIRDRKGLIGLNYLIYFLREEDPMKADMEDVARHIDHLLALGAENVIALGSDFDGAKVPQSFDSLEKIKDLYRYLLARYGQTLTDKIFYENGREFFRRNF